jgi:diacylglycerol O-acyltransferase
MKITALGALDALFLHLETAATPMHVGALHLLEAPAGVDLFAAIRRHLAARLSASPVFTRRLRTLPLALANPLWEHCAVDLAHHLRRLRLPAPGDRRQLEASVARLHSLRLDRSRPLWQFFFIEGLAEGGCALYTKVHHAAVDGAAGVALAQALFDLSPEAAAAPLAATAPARTQPAAGSVEVLAAALARNGRAGVELLRQAPSLALATLRRLPAGGGALISWARQFAFAPPTILNRTIDGARSVALASLPLASLRAVAHAREATINDVLLAVVGGALREYLSARGELPPPPLLAAMPVSLREGGDTRMNTQATMAQASLATDIGEPLARLQAIREAAGAAKALSRELRPAFDLTLPSIGMPWLLSAAAALYGAGRLAERLPLLANVVVSNVPGPAVPLYIAGARLRNWWPLSIVEHGLGLNITVLRYGDSLECGLVAAQRLVPDPAPLAQALHDALAELAAAVGAMPALPQRRRAAAGAPAPAVGAAAAGDARPRAKRRPRGGGRAEP